MKSILLIEDEPGLILTLTDRLKSEGFLMDTAKDGERGFDKAVSNVYDLILLDLMLPKKSGLDICKDLRSRGIATPVLMLTAKGLIVDKVVGLKLGADDYLTKPFDMSELIARIEALLRRTMSTGSSMHLENGYKFDNVLVDFRSAEIKKEGKLIELSAQEYRLLRYMIEHRGATLSRDELLEHAWNYDDSISTRTIDVHIAGLRQKLEAHPKHPKYFITVHRLGYKFLG